MTKVLTAVMISAGLVVAGAGVSAAVTPGYGVGSVALHDTPGDPSINGGNGGRGLGSFDECANLIRLFPGSYCSETKSGA
ncbi:MAG: hypothetical protein JWN03_8497 [Nocardia sp.]|uniref:hypothetical protein n=1 Tax=Nocardia sp. TaxID=1821 RepID=UPI0026184772|nr:hypothetical protein [Nocardia sp.]MCU1648222.1 hypothetical protein [Nocardia sp.]